MLLVAQYQQMGFNSYMAYICYELLYQLLITQRKKVSHLTNVKVKNVNLLGNKMK